jgi:hypothetical protein
MFVSAGRLGIRRRSTLTCCRNTKFLRLDFGSRLKQRSQNGKDHSQQIGHQAASLPRLFRDSMPNLIFGTHRCCNGHGLTTPGLQRCSLGVKAVSGRDGRCPARVGDETSMPCKSVLRSMRR